MTKCVVGLHMYVNVEAETEARAHVAAAALVSGLPNLNDHAMEFAYVPHTWKKSRRSIFEHIPAATTSGMSNRATDSFNITQDKARDEAMELITIEQMMARAVAVSASVPVASHGAAPTK